MTAPQRAGAEAARDYEIGVLGQVDQSADTSRRRHFAVDVRWATLTAFWATLSASSSTWRPRSRCACIHAGSNDESSHAPAVGGTTWTNVSETLRSSAARAAHWIAPIELGDPSTPTTIPDAC